MCNGMVFDSLHNFSHLFINIYINFFKCVKVAVFHPFFQCFESHFNKNLVTGELQRHAVFCCNTFFSLLALKHISVTFHNIFFSLL